jgi:hypothetical protein
MPNAGNSTAVASGGRGNRGGCFDLLKNFFGETVRPSISQENHPPEKTAAGRWQHRIFTSLLFHFHFCQSIVQTENQLYLQRGTSGVQMA